MAKFYGEIDGRRAKVHRLHHGPLTVRACSWHGGVETTLYERDGETFALIETIRWRGAGRRNLVYDGPLSAMQDVKPKTIAEMTDAEILDELHPEGWPLAAA